MLKPQEIKKIREKLGLTQKRLAELLGVKLNTVGKWECGAAPCDGPAAAYLRHLDKGLRVREPVA